MIPLTSIGTVFAIVAVLMIVAAPRRWAAVALVVGACYMVLSQGLKLGPFHFFVIRLLILVGLVRILIRRERPATGLNALDWVMVCWAGWALFASLFRENPSETLVFNLGLVFNACGVYFLLRSLLQSSEDAVWLCRAVLILLVPIAIEMFYEQVAAHNLFSKLGGVPEMPTVREGRLRAQGPFAHAILAGTVGAVCLPLAVSLWYRHRAISIMGVIACITIVITSASSGPLLSAMSGVFALSLWRFRVHMRAFRWTAVILYIILDLAMKVPPYYLMGRIDLAGGSTGWHRAELIHSAFQHLSEWWWAGTDYTRHWMPTGVTWSPNHTDITNQYLLQGVHGGLPLLLLFVSAMAIGFAMVGKVVKSAGAQGNADAFFAWALGSSLFAHATTGVSVAYFDQSFLFIYLTLAAIATFASGAVVAKQPDGQVVPGSSRNRRFPRRGVPHPHRPGRAVPRNMKEQGPEISGEAQTARAVRSQSGGITHLDSRRRPK